MVLIERFSLHPWVNLSLNKNSGSSSSTLVNSGLLKIRPYMSHFRKNYKRSVFQMRGRLKYWALQLLFSILCDLLQSFFDFGSFMLFTRMFVKKKTFCIKVFTKIKRKMCLFHSDGKKFQHKEIKNSCI